MGEKERIVSFYYSDIFVILNPITSRRIHTWSRTDLVVGCDPTDLNEETKEILNPLVFTMDGQRKRRAVEESLIIELGWERSISLIFDLSSGPLC